MTYRPGQVGAALCALLAVLVGCSDRSPLEPDPPVHEARGGNKGGGGSGNGGGGAGEPTVSEADPPRGRQGEVQLEVRILGSGFDETAEAIWERDGVPASGIVTTNTRFVSPSELLATIDIASDAELDLYDIGVYIGTGPGRKKGVGIDLFQVQLGVQFHIPVEGFDIVSDGAYASGGFSAYIPGTCGVGTNLYRDGTGDATLDVDDTGKQVRKCPHYPRALTFRWPDGTTEVLEFRLNLGAIGGAGGILGIPIGETRPLAMNIRVGKPAGGPGGSDVCRILKFRNHYWGDPTQPSQGGRDVLVHRADARTWHVSTPTAAESTAECTRPDDTLVPMNLSISLTVFDPMG